MYLRILKKDLKRKKTMNIIVLLFMILATMFVASGVNNVMAVFGGLDGYFDKANVPDYVMLTLDKGDPKDTEAVLQGIDEIDSYGAQPMVIGTTKSLAVLDEEEALSPIVISCDSACLNYFDKDNNRITEVKPGTVWVGMAELIKSDKKAGDKITYKNGDYTKEFEIAGGMKDAIFSADLMGNVCYMLCEEDFREIYELEQNEAALATFFQIKTSDIETVQGKTKEISAVFEGSRSMLKSVYIMDMLVAAAMVVVSVLLIITAFIVVRFTISFTLSEEFREIGVMKAIGIRNRSVRMLYITKFFGLAIAGAAVGFFLSIPFGKMMLDSVTKTMVLESKGGLLVNLICAVAVVAIVVLFCYLCTRRIVKATPMDAIRSGQTGERYRKKSLIRLTKTKLNTTGFLAVNDVFSAPKRYVIIIVTVMLLLTPVLVMANTSKTLKSENIVPLLGVNKADVYGLVGDPDWMSSNGRQVLGNYLDEKQEELKDRGISAKLSSDVQFNFKYINGDKSYKFRTLQGIRTKTDDYEYDEGTAPANVDEIAISYLISEKLDAKIGDTVTIELPDGKRDFLVSALFQSMNNMGECVRIHEDLDIGFEQLSGIMATCVDYEDDPTDEEFADRLEILDEVFDSTFYDTSEFVNRMTGVGSMIDGVSVLILCLATVVAALVAVLMERSHIEKERGEISLRKAIGFKSGSIVAQHVIRMGLVSLIAVVITAAFSTPVTSLLMNPVFVMMGAKNVDFATDPLNVFFIYPLIILAVTVLFTFFTALRVSKITTAEIRGIE